MQNVQNKAKEEGTNIPVVFKYKFGTGATIS
jgi:hypothetical protein